MPDILVEIAGALGRIKLDRPKAINALTLEMIQGITAALHTFAADPCFGAVLMRQKSPISMKVTLKMLRDARRSASLKICLEREFAAAHVVLASDKFHEGARAAVVDKDRNPHWRPASLVAVTPAILAPCFAPSSNKIF